VLTDFLRPDHPAGSTTIGKLMLATCLWTVMKNVFASAWLSNTAEVILRQLLTNEFHLENDDSRAAWCELYEDLVLVGVPSIIDILVVEDQIDSARGSKRVAWEVVANNWHAYEDKLGWQTAIDFLLIPLGYCPFDFLEMFLLIVTSPFLRLWSMSAYDDELWDTILRSTIRRAANATIASVEVVQNIVERIRAKNLGLVIS
jgi:hypothetical protein